MTTTATVPWVKEFMKTGESPESFEGHPVMAGKDCETAFVVRFNKRTGYGAVIPLEEAECGNDQIIAVVVPSVDKRFKYQLVLNLDCPDEIGDLGISPLAGERRARISFSSLYRLYTKTFAEFRPSSDSMKGAKLFLSRGKVLDATRLVASDNRPTNKHGFLAMRDHWAREAATLIEMDNNGKKSCCLLQRYPRCGDEFYETYRAIEVPGSPKTVNEAFRALIPEQYRSHRNLWPVGEWFVIQEQIGKFPKLSEVIAEIDEDEVWLAPLASNPRCDCRYELQTQDGRIDREGTIWSETFLVVSHWICNEVYDLVFKPTRDSRRRVFRIVPWTAIRSDWYEVL